MINGSIPNLPLTDGGIIFITGGARSGKSSYAQQIALALSNNPVYVATAKVWDDDFEKRVQRHKNHHPILLLLLHTPDYWIMPKLSVVHSYFYHFLHHRL